MDLDAYVAAHGSEWRRLEDLTRKRRLSGAEADEPVDRYQQVATHLSVVRTAAPDPTLVAHLSSLLPRPQPGRGTGPAPGAASGSSSSSGSPPRCTGCAGGGSERSRSAWW